MPLPSVQGRATRLLLLAGAVLVLAIYGHDWHEKLGGPRVLHERFGYQAVAVTLPLQIGAVVVTGGEELIAMANGLVYGLALGSLLTWIGWYVGSIIQYGIGRTARSDLALKHRMARAPNWLRRLPVSHPAFIIFSRWLIPGLGGHIATLVPGAAGVAFRRFAWCTAIGTALPSIGWTYAGLYFAGL